MELKEILFTPEEIDKRVGELAEELTEKFKDADPMVVGVLNGSCVFCSDLVRKLPFPLEMQFIKASSYKDATVSSGIVSIDDFDLDIKDREVILVEDIVDSGTTLEKLKSLFEGLGAKSVTTVSLLDKPSRRTVDFKADYIGFEIEDKFVVGYGLDYAQMGRNYPFIGVLDENKL